MTKDLLSDLEKRREELRISNEDISKKLQENIYSLAKASNDIEELDKEFENPPISVKIELDQIKNEFNQKKTKILKVLEEIKPIEFQLSKREELIKSLTDKIKNYESEVESKKRNILEYKKYLQKIESWNINLKESVVEKDSMIKILKDRLSKKTNEFKDLQSKNEILQEQIQENNEKIAEFNDIIDELKQDFSGKLPPRIELEMSELKKEISSKTDQINELIASLEPLREEVFERDDLIDSLNNTIDEKESEIGELSNQLSELKESKEKYESGDSKMKQLLVEKEGSINILKTKINQHADNYNDLLNKHTSIQEELAEKNKQVLAYKNRVDAIESRVHSTNDQNQRILYELMNSKTKIKSLEEDLEKSNNELSQLKSDLSNQLEINKRNEEEKRAQIMERQAKKFTLLHSHIASLRSRIKRQQALLDAKVMKEREIMRLFGNQMKELLNSSEFSIDLPNEPIVDSRESFDDILKDSPFPDLKKVEELLPQVEHAFDHGESKEQIIDSLLQSGYEKSDIDEAIGHVQNNR